MVKILVIDDAPDFLHLVEELLANKGANVILAHNGCHGLELFKENQPDLVLTDVFMPAMDGIDLITEIRKIDSQVPIIVMSGGFVQGPSYDEEAFVQGADASVAKSSVFDELIPCMQSLGIQF